MAEKAEVKDVPECTGELKSLVEELRGVGREMTFILTMVTNIASHVGPKIEPVNDVAHLKPGAAFEAVVADMQLMYSLFSNFTPHVDRKLRSFYRNIEELEERIKELEAKNAQGTGSAADDSMQAGHAFSTTQMVELFPSVFQIKEPVFKLQAPIFVQFKGGDPVHKQQKQKSPLSLQFKGEDPVHKQQKQKSPLSLQFNGKDAVHKQQKQKTPLSFGYKGKDPVHKQQKQKIPLPFGYKGKAPVHKQQKQKIPLPFGYKGEDLVHQQQEQNTSLSFGCKGEDLIHEQQKQITPLSFPLKEEDPSHEQQKQITPFTFEYKGEDPVHEQQKQTTPFPFVLKENDPVHEPTKVTVTRLNAEAPDVKQKLSAEDPGESDALNVGVESTSCAAIVGTACKETKEPNSPSDSSAVTTTPASSSDEPKLETLASSFAHTSAMLTSASSAADPFVQTPVPVPDTKPSDAKYTSDTDADVKTPLCAKSTEKTSSTTTNSDLSVPDGPNSSTEDNTEPTTVPLPTESCANLNDFEGKEEVSSSEATTKSKKRSVLSSSLRTAVVMPRVSPASPVEATDSVTVTSSSSSPAETNQSQSSSPSDLVGLSPPSPAVAARETQASATSSSRTESSQSQTPRPAVGVSPLYPSVVVRETATLTASSSRTQSSHSQTSSPLPSSSVVASETKTVTSLTPTRSTQSNQTFAAPSCYFTPPTYHSTPAYSTPPTYQSTPAYSTPTYDSRRYSTSSTESFASSSSGGTPTSTKKYQSFVSEPMRDKPVTKLGGVGTAIGSRLRSSGYTQASDLQAKFESFNGDRQSFNTWFKSTAGGNSRHANDCYNSLNNYRY